MQGIWTTYPTSTSDSDRIPFSSTPRWLLRRPCHAAPKVFLSLGAIIWASSSINASLQSSDVPKAPPGRETNPIKPHKQDLTPLPPKKTPIVIYGEAHLSSDRPCNICGSLIPQARIDLQPNVARCVSCQAQYEKVVDTSRKVDEGFGGSREEVRKMKAKQWGEMVNRGGSIRPKKPKRTR